MDTLSQVQSLGLAEPHFSPAALLPPARRAVKKTCQEPVFVILALNPMASQEPLWDLERFMEFIRMLAVLTCLGRG